MAKNKFQSDEDIFAQYLDVIRAEQKASVRFLQNRFRLGFQRATRIMAELEKRGLVGRWEKKAR